MVPYENVNEVSVVKGIEIYPVKTLKEVAEHFTGIKPLQSKSFENVFMPSQNMYSEDFSDVKGQKNAKRALEVAASGGHNVIMLYMVLSFLLLLLP